MLPALITCHKFDSPRCQCGLIVSGKREGGKREEGVFPHSFELQNINDALIAANGIQIVPLCASASLAAQLNHSQSRRAIKTRAGEADGEWVREMGNKNGNLPAIKWHFMAHKAIGYEINFWRAKTKNCAEHQFLKLMSHATRRPATTMPG